MGVRTKEKGSHGFVEEFIAQDSGVGRESLGKKSPKVTKGLVNIVYIHVEVLPRRVRCKGEHVTPKGILSHRNKFSDRKINGELISRRHLGKK